MVEKFWRLSLVKMYYAEIKKDKTPDPFLEIRTFVFLKDKPSRIQELAWKKVMEKEIEFLKEKLLRHIFDSPKNRFWEEKRQLETVIRAKPISKWFKIEIDGWEVERIDIDEVMREYYMGVEGHWFRPDRIEKRRLRLITEYVYRYFAFFDEEGRIKGEYDEFDIIKALKQIEELERRERELREAMSRYLSEIMSLVKEFRKSAKEYEKIIEQLRRLRPSP